MTSKTKPTLYESQREVAALRKQLAERDAEIERLKEVAANYRSGHIQADDERDELRAELKRAASERDRLLEQIEDDDVRGELENAEARVAEKDRALATKDRALATKDLELAAVQAREVRLREHAGRAEHHARCAYPRMMADHSAGHVGAPPDEDDCNCGLSAALALPADSTALREVCERVAEAAWRSRDEAQPGFIGDATPNTKAIVDRVLGGAAK